MLRSILLILAVIGGAACQTTQQPSFQLDDAITERRDAQIRTFAGHDRTTVMRVAADSLRDLGFTVVAIEDDLGLIGAKKETDVSQTRNTVMKVALLMLGGEVPMPNRELLEISLVVSDSDLPSVYAACQRTVFDDMGGRAMLGYSGRIDEAEFYERIFDAMTTALFLEEQL